MNCAECRELLVADLEGLLEDTQKRAVADHLKTCQACRAESTGLQTLRQRLVSNGKALAESSLEDEVMNRIIREQSARLKSAAQAGAGLRLRRLIMKSPMAKMAAAAVVVIACITGVMFWTGTESIALAEVLARVEQIQAYAYKTKMTTENPTMGTTTTESTVLVSNEYGMRVDQAGVNSQNGRETKVQLVTGVLPQKKAVVIVDLVGKQYSRMTLDEATLENARTQNHDPREILKSLLACQYQDLGTSVIEGKKVHGFETTDPSYAGSAFTSVHVTLWVDVATWLPVRSETELEMGQGDRASAVDYDYQWDVAVEARLFEPEIPAGFTANPLDGTQMPSFSEKGFIEALQMAADFTGHYPKTIDNDGLRQLTMDIVNAMTTSDRPAAQQWREELKQLKNTGSAEAAMRGSQERMMKLMALTMFNVVLGGQQKDPVYHGDVVTSKDVGLPLMRWKVSESEYRVIFGDLHAATVNADTLVKLEAALPK